MIEKHEIFRSDLWGTEFLGMFNSFHDRKCMYTEKDSPLLQPPTVFLHCYKLASQLSMRTCTTLKSHTSPARSHISNPHPPVSWARRAAPSTAWVPAASAATAAAGQPGATGTHRNKLVLTAGLKVAPSVEWWLKLSLAKCFPTQGAGNCFSHLKVTLSPWSQE